MTLRPEDSLGYQVNHLARLFEQALRHRIGPYGIVPGQFPALLTLYEEDGLTQTELARRVDIEQPTMAYTLKRMERDGLVRRLSDPDDGRRAHIRLTPRAKKLEQALTAAAQEVNSHATEALRPAELSALMRTLAGLIARLER